MLDAANTTPLAVPCKWRGDGYGIWETDCGNMFCTDTDGPFEDDFKFCPFCGREIKDIA